MLSHTDSSSFKRLHPGNTLCISDVFYSQRRKPTVLTEDVAVEVIQNGTTYLPTHFIVCKSHFFCRPFSSRLVS